MLRALSRGHSDTTVPPDSMEARKNYRELLAIKRNTADSRLPSKPPRSIHPRVEARKEGGRSSDLRAFRSRFGAHRISTGHRFPGIYHPSAYDGFRSLLPLRGSPGFSPGSHLIADSCGPRTVHRPSMRFAGGPGQGEGFCRRRHRPGGKTEPAASFDIEN